MKLNLKKGFFRITFILSILSAILGIMATTLLFIITRGFQDIVIASPFYPEVGYPWYTIHTLSACSLGILAFVVPWLVYLAATWLVYPTMKYIIKGFKGTD